MSHNNPLDYLTGAIRAELQAAPGKEAQVAILRRHYPLLPEGAFTVLMQYYEDLYAAKPPAPPAAPDVQVTTIYEVCNFFMSPTVGVTLSPVSLSFHADLAEANLAARPRLLGNVSDTVRPRLALVVGSVVYLLAQPQPITLQAPAGE